jgi:hypothetical protein
VLNIRQGKPQAYKGGHMNLERLRTRASVRAALGSVAAIGALLAGGLLPAASADAQEMYCEEDPIVFVRADDGARFHLNLYAGASTQIAPDQLVTAAAMRQHLHKMTDASVMSAVRDGDTYAVVVAANTSPWANGTVFLASYRMEHKRAGASSERVSSPTGTPAEVSLAIPAGALAAAGAW